MSGVSVVIQFWLVLQYGDTVGRMIEAQTFVNNKLQSTDNVMKKPGQRHKAKISAR